MYPAHVLVTSWYTGNILIVHFLAELVLLVLLLLCALYDVTVYVNIHLSAKRVQLTPAQKRLLGVSSIGEHPLE